MEVLLIHIHKKKVLQAAHSLMSSAFMCSVKTASNAFSL